MDLDAKKRPTGIAEKNKSSLVAKLKAGSGKLRPRWSLVRIDLEYCPTTTRETAPVIN
jgi:hypothetical protein